MKVTVHTPVCLVFEAKPWGMGFIVTVSFVGGLAASIATLSMGESMSLHDEFVRLGLGMLAVTVLVSLGLAWVGVRVRRLIFDARYDEVRYESRGLGRSKTTTWLLHELVRVDVAEVGSVGELTHFTRLLWGDAAPTHMSAMDPPTVQQIERNVRTINQWLEALRTQHP